MTRKFALDTGPFVALLTGRDRHHSWARQMFDMAAPPLVTCESVISEACFLLRDVKGGAEGVFEFVERRAVEISFRLADQHAAVRALMAKYADVPMSLADACLVRMTELDPKLEVLTLDADFRVYRRHGRQVVPAVMPS